MTLDLGQKILMALAEKLEEIATRPAPRPWQLEAYDHEQDVLYGPRYSPAAWFGVRSEAERVRYLRSLRRLADAGLVELVGVEGGKRFNRLRLTPAGWDAVAEIRASQHGVTPA